MSDSDGCNLIFVVSLLDKGGDLTQSYDKSPYTNRNVKKAKWQHKTPQKKSIKQQLRTDLGRSVGVTTATQLVWFTRFTGPNLPTHHSVGQTSRSLGQKLWNEMKATRNTDAQYENPISSSLKVMAKVKVFQKYVKHPSHKVKNYGTLWKVLLYLK